MDDGLVDEGTDVWMMDRWMKGWRDGWINGWMDRWRDEVIDSRMIG